MNNLKRISIITGHYGSGKTNIAVDMAIKLKESGEKVTIVDLDIVNPYFRTADFKEMLEGYGINVIAPNFANTNLDIPSLPPQINSVFDNNDSYVIIDVGGDDAGAIALGRYANEIIKQDYDMFYVINEYRYQTKDAKEAISLLHDIEYCARVKATKLINNSNLGNETTLDNVLHSLKFANDISKETGLPLEFSCIKDGIDIGTNDLMPVKIYVQTVWQK